MLPRLSPHGSPLILSRRFVATAVTLVAFSFGMPAAQAQITTVYSSNTLTDTANPSYDFNTTTIINGGGPVYSNNTSVLFGNYAAPKKSTLTFTTQADPTGFSRTPVVIRDATLNSYTGPVVAGTSVISPFSGADLNNGAVGYYLYTVPFTLSGTNGYNITGSIHSDNETYDVLLDYTPGTATTAAQTLSLSGTNIRATTNDATSNGTFKTTSLQANGSGNHTLSFVIYNNVGATDISYQFSAQAIPEPASWGLLAAGACAFCPCDAAEQGKKRPAQPRKPMSRDR